MRAGRRADRRLRGAGTRTRKVAGGCLWSKARVGIEARFPSTMRDPAAVQCACTGRVWSEELLAQCWDGLAMPSGRRCQLHGLRALGACDSSRGMARACRGGQTTWMRQQRANAAAARISGCTLCRRSDRRVTAPCSATAAAICTALGLADALLDPALHPTCVQERQPCTAAPPPCTVFEAEALLLLNINLHHTWRGDSKQPLQPSSATAL